MPCDIDTLKDPPCSTDSEEPLTSTCNKELQYDTDSIEPSCVAPDDSPLRQSEEPSGSSTMVHDIAMEDECTNECSEEIGINEELARLAAATELATDGYSSQQDDVASYAQPAVGDAERVERLVSNSEEPSGSLGGDLSEERLGDESDMSGDLREFELSRLTGKRSSQEKYERLAYSIICHWLICLS